MFHLIFLVPVSKQILAQHVKMPCGCNGDVECMQQFVLGERAIQGGLNPVADMARVAGETAGKAIHLPLRRLRL